MSSTLFQGAVLLSVDLPTREDLDGEIHPRTAQDLIRALVGTFQDYQLPATWTIDFDGSNRHWQSILYSELDHELALYGNPAWTGSKVPRSRFLQCFQQRLKSIRQQQLTVTSLVLPAGNCVHPDLVLKYGFSTFSTRQQQRRAAPNKLKYGLWEIPTTKRLLEFSRWQNWLPRRQHRLASQLNQLANTHHSQEILHMVIDSKVLLSQAERGWKLLEQTLELIHHQQLEMNLPVLTVSQLSTWLGLPKFVTIPTRSVLKNQVA